MKRNGKKVILIANVAEKMDFKKWVVLSIEACQRDCPSPIDDNDRVVHDHAQRDDQSRQRNSIQLDPERVEKS